VCPVMKVGMPVPGVASCRVMGPGSRGGGGETPQGGGSSIREVSMTFALEDKAGGIQGSTME